MKIAVCIKQVPDTEARLRVRKDGLWIEEDDVPFKINESDEFALEAALKLAEATGGEVIAVGLGPARVAESLRKAMAIGATRSIHLADPAFAGGDALATGRALAAAIQREGCQLVVTGSQSDDNGYGATGSVLAAFLGWPHAWLLMGIELADNGSAVEVVREMEGGANEVLRLSLPAVLEVQAGINHPRYASLKGIMAAKKKPMEVLGPSDLGLDANTVGAAGSRVSTVSVAFPDSSAGAQMIEGDAKAAAQTLVDRLRSEAKVL